jgi:DNA-directed RNA polymerase specialized sigma24 family protein
MLGANEAAAAGDGPAAALGALPDKNIEDGGAASEATAPADVRGGAKRSVRGSVASLPSAAAARRRAESGEGLSPREIGTEIGRSSGVVHAESAPVAGCGCGALARDATSLCGCLARTGR